MKKIAIILSLLSCFHFLSAQTDTLPAFVRDSIDNYVQQALMQSKIPGVSVAIVKNGKVVFIKGYGQREMGGTEAVDENTLFMIGSNSKAFSATALAILDAEKKLSLDDKVQKWLPGFKMQDPYLTREIMVRDLLCHRLGFETFQGDFMYFDSDLTTAEVIEKFGKLKPLYGFRSRWGYTNAAFAVAGEVLRSASGKTWAEFLKERIFQPLGMDRTLALSTEIQAATNKATAHTVVEGQLKKIPYGNIDNIAPAGSISSSARDLTRWMIAQLGNGTIDGKPVIPAAAISQTRFPHSIMGNGQFLYNRGHFQLYGLGWMLEEYSGRKIVSHTGGVNGFVTSVTLIPEEKLGIVVLTNTDQNMFYEALKWEIMDAYLGNIYRNYSKNYKGYLEGQEKREMAQLKKLRDTVAMQPKTALPLKAYAGNYVHEVYGKMTIKEENGKMIMRFEHHHGRYGTLEPMGGNRFLCTYSDPLYGIKVLPFTVTNGKVQSVTITVADFVEFTPYEFKKLQ